MIKDRGFRDPSYYRGSRLKSTILSIQSISRLDLSYLGLDSWHFVTAGSVQPGPSFLMKISKGTATMIRSTQNNSFNFKNRGRSGMVSDSRRSKMAK